MDNGKLSPQLISADLAALFQSATNAAVEWTSSTVDEAKRQLKFILFQAQNGRCAYCRRIISDEPGHVEIDHILPKKPNGNKVLWSSNEKDTRKSTSGYAQFTFVAHNLALACKRCNNKKGTYDCRRDRTVAPSAEYTLDEDFYEWLHIYAHNYSDHIQILDGLIYQIVDGSSNGEAVISVCKLDEIAAVEKASAELKANNATSVSIAIGLLLSQVMLGGWDFVIDAVASQFPDTSLEVIEAEADKYRQIFK